MWLTRPPLATMLLALCCLSPSSPAELPTFRLSRSVLPSHYDLFVETHLSDGAEDFNFLGHVVITLRATETGVSTVRLHAKDLEVPAASAQLSAVGAAGAAQAVRRLGRDAADDLLLLELEAPLEPGVDYRLRLNFSGVLGQGLAGYYRSSYEDPASNQTRWLAVTQFEPTDARRAFPCFDEPSFKAVFTVSLAHLDKYTAASNMPLESSQPMPGRPGWTLSRFAPSERMSTYLVAFLVSDLRHFDSATADNSTQFRVWARTDALRQAAYAARVGPQVLSFYEDFFRVPYPLPKQDMAAIPDFAAGAMENWGLITYRERLLLFDPEESSTEAQHDVTSVIAHELAHQWFGNLVTMRWWSDLWLNEGFATYVATLGVHAVHPNWKSLESDALSNMLTVFKFDALQTSHPLSVPLKHPSEIAQIFDAISYKKGSFLIRMMSHFLGEDVFRQGLTSYLQEHRLDNAEQDDLWAALTAEAHRQGALPDNMTVKAVMDSWTLQTGYPVLTVSRDYESGVANITQARYQAYQRGDARRSGGGAGCWQVPVTFASGRDPRQLRRAWLQCEELQLSASPHHWLLLNVNATGLYRVMYDERGWQQLTQALEEDADSVPPLNRAQLLADALELAWSGDLSYRSALSLLSYLREEQHYLPWKAALTSLRGVHRLLRRTPGYGVLQKYLLDLLEEPLERWGDLQKPLPGDDLEALRHRELVVSWACRLQEEGCVEQSRRLFREWRAEPHPDTKSPVPRALRYVVTCTALRHGNAADWEFAWQRYLSCAVPSERVELLQALTCTRESWLLHRLLDWSIAEDKGIRRQDSSTVFSGVAANEHGLHIATDFLTRNVAKLHAFYGPKQSRLARYVKAVSEGMFTDHELREFNAFAEESAEYLKRSSLAVQQARDKVGVNAAWYRSHYQGLVALLAELAA